MSAKTASPTERLELFSDGVFAIAATLLVIDVAVPVLGTTSGLLSALLHQWTSYVAYALSFVVIGIMWVNHHATFDRVASIDRALMFWNLLVLGLVAFIPFPTALLAHYVDQGGSNARVATATYALVLMSCSLAFAGLWWHLGRHRELLDEDCEEHAPQVALRRSLLGAGVYLVGLVLAVIWPPAAVTLFIAVTVAFMFAERPARMTEPEPG